MVPHVLCTAVEYQIPLVSPAADARRILVSYPESGGKDAETIVWEVP